MNDIRFRRATGILLIATPLIFTLFFSLLQARFDYPMILVAPADQILRQFYAGGSGLIAIWYGFMFSALLLIPLVVMLYQVMAVDRSRLLMLATTFGLLAGLVQVLGLLRWVFLVPYLSQLYVDPTTLATTRISVALVFQAFNHFAGNGVGEHFGYLFTSAWTALIGVSMLRSSIFRPWLGWLSLLPAVCILAGLFTPLGVVFASTLNQLGYIVWSLWLIIAGVMVLRARPASSSSAASLAK